MGIARRTGLLAAVSVAACAVATPSCSRPARAFDRRVIVLGFDGLDYELTRDLIGQGRLPNFARLANAGVFQPLETSVPPQSPVAWSSVITGLDPGSHGIFDFIHRDPGTMVPYLSTTKTEAAARSLKVGKYQFPLSGGTVELLREGQPFWEALEARGVPTTVIRMPANFPPSGSATRELSGMGTPDILGTYGTFSFYTSEPFAFQGSEVSGGTVYPVDIVDNVVQASLHGPDNPFLREPEKVKAEFTVYVDPSRPVAKIVVGDEERVVKVGEWTDWVPVEFDLMFMQKVGGMARFYLKQVRPDFQLYASPVNLDPMAPAMPISTPEEYASELAGSTGRFYTQGMPEDTKSLSSGVLSAGEFLAQARVAGEENRRQYRYVLDRFEGGLLFYYFGNVDQVSHMMWRARDPGHPAYDPKTDPEYRSVIEELYVGLDRVVGDTLERLGSEGLLIVMSDHGFTSWRRAFHLNSWLEQNGYLAVIDPNSRDLPGFAAVDWSKTRAYGLGLNGLYINVRGREKNGIVPPGQREALAKEIAGRLLKVVDPATGQPAITKVYRREEAYKEVKRPEIAPDLIVGYAKGTRGSNDSALGEVPVDMIVDNKDPWSGDHCMDHETVPGIFLVSRRPGKPVKSLVDVAPAILKEFGVEGFPGGGSR
jgi:predicted AlkP superfamily phosphohydrolase/phosphomutase